MKWPRFVSCLILLCHARTTSNFIFFEKQFDKKIDDRAGMWHEKWWSTYQKSIEI